MWELSSDCSNDLFAPPTSVARHSRSGDSAIRAAIIGANIIFYIITVFSKNKPMHVSKGLFVFQNSPVTGTFSA
jgi:hypothetical protein